MINLGNMLQMQVHPFREEEGWGNSGREDTALQLNLKDEGTLRKTEVQVLQCQLTRVVEIGHGFPRACLPSQENSVGWECPGNPIMACGNCALKLTKKPELWKDSIAGLSERTFCSGNVLPLQSPWVTFAVFEICVMQLKNWIFKF